MRFDDDGQYEVEEEEVANEQKGRKVEEGESIRIVLWEHHVREVGRCQADEELPDRGAHVEKAILLGAFKEDDARPCKRAYKGDEDEEDTGDLRQGAAHQIELGEEDGRVEDKEEEPKDGRAA